MLTFIRNYDNDYPLFDIRFSFSNDGWTSEYSHIKRIDTGNGFTGKLFKTYWLSITLFRCEFYFHYQLKKYTEKEEAKRIHQERMRRHNEKSIY